MKYCSFFFEGKRRYGFELKAGTLVNIARSGQLLAHAGRLPSSSEALFQAPDLRTWLEGGREAHQLAAEMAQLLNQEPVDGVLSQKRVRLTAPIHNPGKIIAIGLNYKDHAEEQKAELPERPLIFAKFPSSVIGTDEPIKLPSISEKVDPEAELCAIVLERSFQVSREAAVGRLAFMVGNDVSARDLQYSDRQWVRGKSCDTFAPTGPFIVTPDEVGDPHNLQIELRRNGEVQQSSNTNQLIFDCYQLVEHISQTATLEPGDIIFTGTPGGVGVYRQPPVFLAPGDLIEVTIEKLGTLRNPVVASGL